MNDGCEQFAGRLRELCEGRGRNGNPHPPRSAVVDFRARLDLRPLLESEFPPDDQILDPVPLSGVGPGCQLEALFTDLQVPYREDCECRAYARQMDIWGVEGCRERFDEIVTRLRENAEKYSFRDHLRAAARAVTTGLLFQLNPLDPFPDLVAEAIRRAEVDDSSREADASSES